MRSLLQFMVTTAIFEQRSIVNSKYQLGTQKPFGIDYTNAALRQTLRDSYELIGDEIVGVGGIRYDSYNIATRQTHPLLLTGWQGLAPDRPDHHLWLVNYAPYPPLHISSSFLGLLIDRLDPAA